MARTFITYDMCSGLQQQEFAIHQVAEALGMTVDIIDKGLTDLAPLKRLTP